ncbi:MAG: thiosulfate sulfurtransferase GlpE [Granulosicoccus sp.]
MPSYDQITSTDAELMIAAKTVTIVDIRDAASFTTRHICNALHLDNSNLEKFISNADMSAPVIVYCYHGNMSQSAASFLAGRGFDEVYSLIGGFSGWAVQYPDTCESGPN